MIGYKPTWVAWPPAFTPSYLKLAGDLADGVYVSQFTTPTTETTDPAVADYLDAIGKRCPEEIEATSTKQGWTFGAAIAAGVERASAGGQEVTPQSFIAALASGEQALGLVPSVTYTADTRAGATKAATYQIENGVLVAKSPYAELPAAN
jgi:hypothetical protein